MKKSMNKVDAGQEKKTRSKRGGGTVRERRPGVWEIRVTTGRDPLKGRSLQTSFTHHGDDLSATRRQAELVALYGVTAQRPTSQAMPNMTVEELLEKFLEAEHRWSTKTRRNHASQVAMLLKDRIRRTRADRLTPASMQRALDRWSSGGMTAATLHKRFNTIHGAIRWAMREQLLADDPLAAMQSPAGPPVRRWARPGEILRLVDVAEARMKAAAEAVEQQPHRRRLHLALFRAEQDVLMVRLASDSALIRGDLVALQTRDLFGRKMKVSHRNRDGRIEPLTDHRRATLTLGAHTAACWAGHVARWDDVKGHGPWLFAATPERTEALTPSGLGQRFSSLACLADLSTVTLHSLRHTVGIYLASEGKLRDASKRLRHRDLSTTYRMYPYAAQTNDQEVADRISQIYGFDDM